MKIMKHTASRLWLCIFLLAIVFGLMATAACLTACDSDDGIGITQLEIIGGDRITLEVGNVISLRLDIPEEYLTGVTWSVSNASVSVDSEGNVTAVEPGIVAVTVSWHSLSDTALIEVIEPSPELDDAERAAFYAEYTPAASLDEALERSKLGLMSGSITVPDQAPTVAAYQPRSNTALVRNSEARYDDEDTYIVVDSLGNEVMRIYRGGGYITLEEVAAYVYAFSDVPANYVSGKNAKPESSIWGEYLRLNHSSFTGNTAKYPYQPVLPNIHGCGGELYYYELDIGTTGTDCDPAYISRTYNDGQTITRGAARIVYARYDKNKNNIIEPDEKYVFYTYNHYNDFQEYLNYYGGWGEIFGNVTGGGKLSSRSDYAPTPCPPTVIDTLIPRSVAFATAGWLQIRMRMAA